jgi:nitrite reductase (NADH) small subunit
VPNEHTICRVDELPDGEHRVVRVGGRELGIFNIRGSFHALPNLCPHQRGPLCAGAVSGTIDCGPHTDFKLAWIWEGEVVTCPWHSLEFHIPTGKCVAFDDMHVRTYEVRVVDDELRVVF